MMFHKLSAAALVSTFALLSNAAVIKMFHGRDCQGGESGEVNVWDNTCATHMRNGFQSFRIVANGGGGQKISAFSHNACIGAVTVCVDAGNVGHCYNSVNNDGGSNAFASHPFCR